MLQEDFRVNHGEVWEHENVRFATDAGNDSILLK